MANLLDRLLGRKPVEASTKEMSLTGYIRRVEAEVSKLNISNSYGEIASPYYWAQEVYSDRVVINSGLRYWEATYTVDDNTITLAPMAEWTEVTQSWEPATLAVTKDAKGEYRWTLISSSSYEDRDGEYVTKAAHEADADRMADSGEYGPLRWWHIGNPDASTKGAGQGLDIGTCDFSTMLGDFRIESGTFVNEAVAQAVQKEAHSLRASIGFFHPTDEPDTGKAFNTIYTYERSLLPKGKESNVLTGLTVKGESMPTSIEERIKSFVSLVGEDTAEGVLAQMEAGQKLAGSIGLAKKEAAETPDPAPEAEPQTETVEVTETATVIETPAEPAAQPAPLTEERVQALISESLKPLQDSLTTQQSEKAKTDNALANALKELTASVNELKGETPRGESRGYVASTAKDNHTSKEVTEGLAPQPQAFGALLEMVVPDVQ